MDQESNYQDKQAGLDRQYREEYNKWIESLSPEERLKLESDGLDAPQIDPCGVGAPELDETRLSDHHWSPHEELLEVAEDERLEGAAEFPAERKDLQDSLCSMVAELFQSKKPARTLAVMGVALGVDGCKLKTVAKLHRCSQGRMQVEAAEMLDNLNAESIRDRVVLARVVGRLISTANARLSLEVLALVSGICYRGLSETEIAKRHGITRAAVSKRCVELTNDLGLPPSRAMKSEKSRKAYAEAQEKHYSKFKKDV